MKTQWPAGKRSRPKMAGAESLGHEYSTVLYSTYGSVMAAPRYNDELPVRYFSDLVLCREPHPGIPFARAGRGDALAKEHVPWARGLGLPPAVHGPCAGLQRDWRASVGLSTGVRCMLLEL